LAIFVVTAVSSGANTITVTFPASAGFEGIFPEEFRGVSTTLDGSATFRTTSGGQIPSASLTTTANGDLVYSIVQGSNSGNPSYCIGMLYAGPPVGGADSGQACFTVQNTAGVTHITGGFNTSGATGVATIGLKP
jgi:hypothetical protein